MFKTEDLLPSINVYKKVDVIAIDNEQDYSEAYVY